MKKITFLGLILSFSLGVFAQEAPIKVEMKKEATISEEKLMDLAHHLKMKLVMRLNEDSEVITAKVISKAFIHFNEPVEEGYKYNLTVLVDPASLKQPLGGVLKTAKSSSPLKYVSERPINETLSYRVYTCNIDVLENDNLYVEILTDKQEKSMPIVFALARRKMETKLDGTEKLDKVSGND